MQVDHSETLRRLQPLRGKAMLSILIPPRDKITRVQLVLQQEQQEATSARSHSLRKELAAIEWAIEKLDEYVMTPKNGLVLLYANVKQPDGSREIIHLAFEPPRPLTTSLFLMDKRCHVDLVLEQMGL